MNVGLIANPVAGSGRARAACLRFVRALERRGVVVEQRFTRARGDARSLAGELEGKVDCLVAAGGDGTLNEVVNGLSDPGATPLAPLGLGTANMLARELGVPRDPERLARRLVAGATRRIDLCYAGPERFLSCAGVGFDGLVTELVAGSRRGTLGYAGYALPILRAVARYRPPRLRVSADGGPPLACQLVIVSNLRNYGGIMRMAPDARADSGWLHAQCFRKASVPSMIADAARAMAGRLTDQAHVEVFAARRIAIGSDDPVAFQTDGDPRGTTPVELRIEPAVVPVKGVTSNF